MNVDYAGQISFKCTCMPPLPNTRAGSSGWFVLVVDDAPSSAQTLPHGAGASIDAAFADLRRKVLAACETTWREWNGAHEAGSIDAPVLYAAHARVLRIRRLLETA